ncbi:uncharacterized protein FIBRA_01271 [Fibroporia radiculosa]|uniref:Association with the SNF1 complex (ASC) domain-containing protein n=1 Tax=Fibroporia radiculosa TaxID=599839 RepID=J4I8E2_9APHY|nr:uncharacterized protein FIBRA_01271 [Fibroporia radiculosa]CCL99256.1 predicted protein [Fibroporia radiculosa]
MGNTTSNPASHSAHSHSPARRGSPARPPSAASQRVHRSLRTKKKSLELPDLASLALTPAGSPSPASVSPHGAYRRPRASSPIPIPTSAQPPQPTFRPQNNLPSAAHIALSNYNDHTRNNKSYLTNASRSFMYRVQEHSPPREDIHKSGFVPEVVYSTLPLALHKAEEDTGNPEPVSVKITYRGAGKAVVLARAGDENWQGRQPMEFDSTTGQWFTFVSLLPGTHHLKFIVDGQWRITDDYPTAVDDRDGSLANYVAVQISSSSSPQIVTTPVSGSISPLASPPHTHPAHINSFWSEASSATGGGISGPDGEGGRSKAEPEWTTEIPSELMSAAAEEEVYLASTDSHDVSSNSSASAFGGIPTPNIPPAPGLPRHLDKLILNVRPSAVSGSPVPGERERSRRSGKDRSRRERDRDGRPRPSHLGMMSLSAAAGINGDGDHLPSPLGLPVVTASGTDITASLAPPSPMADNLKANTAVTAVGKLEYAGSADDASVLPVPSHVVLHHLSTSAIKNGVLAVANTTRYRKKVRISWISAPFQHSRRATVAGLLTRSSSQYITTIYYKPT